MYPAKPRVRKRAKARMLVSSVRRSRSLTPVMEARALRAELGDLLIDVRGSLSDVKFLVERPCLFIHSDPATAEFHGALNEAVALVRDLGSESKLETVRAALLTARLSWDIAKENALLRARRNAGPDALRLSNEAAGALALARVTLSSGDAKLEKIATLLRDGGLAVELPFH